MCSKRNPDPCTVPEGLPLPLERDQLEAAKAMAADNKGGQWAAGQAPFLLGGARGGLRKALGALLWECEAFPTATISDMTGYSGRELRAIVDADPISLFACLGCTESIVPKDRRHFVSLSRELRSCSCSTRNAV